MELEILDVVGAILVLLSGLFLVSVFSPQGHRPVRRPSADEDEHSVVQWRRFT